MINGKVCIAFSSTSSTQRCYLCGASFKKFNNINEMIKLNIDDSDIEFGRLDFTFLDTIFRVLNTFILQTEY